MQTSRTAEEIIQRLSHNMYSMSLYLNKEDLYADMKADFNVLANEVGELMEEVDWLSQVYIETVESIND